MIQANYLISEPTLFPTRNFDEFFYKIEFPLPTMPLSYPGYHAISWIPNSHLPSLLIYHDSFGSWDLNNFLAMNFSRIFYVHRSSSPLFLNKQTIEQFSPDIMIYEVVERDVDVLKNDLLWCAKK